jgi:hypothetical protein
MLDVEPQQQTEPTRVGPRVPATWANLSPIYVSSARSARLRPPPAPRGEATPAVNPAVARDSVKRAQHLRGRTRPGSRVLALATPPNNGVTNRRMRARMPGGAGGTRTALAPDRCGHDVGMTT